LAKRKTAKFDPKKFNVLYQEGLKEIINAKIQKRPAKLGKGKPPPGNVVNIMDALKKSLAQPGGAAKKVSKRKSKPKAKSKAKSRRKAA
jgi:DNA end-binding protein Ku